MRKTGIDVIGNVPWGTHMCQFYKTQADLIDILVPYFKEGLESNELCMWVTSEPLEVAQARKALLRAVRNLSDYIDSGQIQILDAGEWYTKSGKFESERVLQGWVDKEKEALKRGYDGLRLTGNTFWLHKRTWRDFSEYEAEIDRVIGDYRMIALCSYPLDKCGAVEVVDVVDNHRLALIRRDGQWVNLQSAKGARLEEQLKDITERKRAEEALRQREEYFHSLTDNAVDVVLVIGADGVRKYVSPSIERVRGYKPEELIGKEAIEGVHPDDVPKIADIFVQLTENPGKLLQWECRLRHKDGTWRIVEGISRNLFDNPVVAGIVSNYRDVTERKRAEEALRHERDNLLNTLNAMKDGVYIINQQNDIVFANPSTKEEFGPYEGKKCCEYFHDFKEPCPWCNSREVIAGKIVRSEWFFPKTGKTYEVVHTPFRETEGSISKLSIIRDITERKRMEEALRESEQTIRQLAKASIRAHEEERQRAALEVHDRISQTLTGAFHQLQALETIPLRDAVAERLLSRASALLQECIGESRNIMKDLYSPVLSDFGVVAVIDEELDHFQEDTGCQARFHATCPDRLPRDVEVNVYRIFQEALMNIRKHAASAREVAVTLTCRNGVVSLQVVDNGPGFDVKAAMQSKRVGGLKGMQRRAELGGGTFEVASSPGKGTTVTVRLPYTSEPSAADTEKEDKKT
jgi:PAS domain S-box-containing protein